MKQKYHDIAFENILKIITEGQFNKAFQWYNQYFEKYPKDYSGYIHYADLLIKVGNFDEANKVLNWINIIPNLRDDTKNEYNIIKLKLLCCEQKYEEAYGFLNAKDIIMTENREIYVFLRKQLQILTNEDLEINIYKFQQIINYSEEALLEHLKKHQETNESEYQSVFSSNFPLENVLQQVKELLPTKNRIYHSHIASHFLFKYDNSGTVHGKNVDYFNVVAFNDTNDIITMYPYENIGKLNAIDLTPEYEITEKPLTRRMSQIEKFKKKYSK